MRICRAAGVTVLVGLLAASVTASAQETAGAAASAKPAAKPEGKPAPKHEGAPAKPAAPAARPKAAPAKAAPAKPGKGAAAGKGKKPPKKPLARKPGSGAGEPDEATRKIIAGTAPSPKTPGRGAESAELRAIRELDLALFPSAAPSSGPAWPVEGTLPPGGSEPRLFASGMPPSPELGPAPGAEPAVDLSWLRQLEMPDIPVRWDARVIRYLEFYKNNPRGRSMVAGWIRKSGRYAGSIRRILREQGLPEDILWLALVESGFDPTIESPAGAAGLWQFMPEGARIYGLTVDRWIDERLDPERSTVAAARYLADLRQRFGGWELAFAAYNMGYGGLLASIRKYNTNDYWELSRFEAGIPFETALYVPKIVAMAIVSRNKALFGCDGVELEPAIAFDRVAVGPGVSVKAVASASGVPVAEIAELNPQIRATRTPPLPPGAKTDTSWVVRVPPGAGARAAKTLPKVSDDEGKLERYLVRWGESLDDIASFRGTTKSTLLGLNGLRRDEVVRPGTVLFVPAAPGVGTAAAANLVAEGPAQRPVVVVPGQPFAYPDRKRVFYRVVPGDTVREVARVFGIDPDELSRWNALDPGAALHDGMTLQVFVAPAAVPRNVLVLAEKDAHVLSAGSPEFFAYFESQKGRRRVEVVAREGDTWKSLAKRYGLSVGMMERINQRARSSALAAGDRLVVYVPSGAAGPDLVPDRQADDKSEVAVAAAPAGEDEAAAKDDDAVKPAVIRTTTVEPDAPEAPPPARREPSDKPR